jgi:hypothetical protein
MDDAKLIKALETDLKTGGHTLYEDASRWTDDEIVRVHHLLGHWSDVIGNDLTRRVIARG